MKTRTSHIWARTFALLITMLLCLSLFAGCGSSDDIFSLMEDGKYDKALSAYRQLSVNERKELADEAEAFVGSTMSALQEGALDVEDALERLAAVNSMRISSLDEILEESALDVLQAIVTELTEAYRSGEESASDVLYSLEELYDFYPFDDMDEDPLIAAEETFAQTHVDTLLQKVGAGELTYEEAMTDLEDIRSYQDIYSAATLSLTEVHRNQAINTAYNSGMASYQSGDYRTAIDKFSQIPSTDGRYEEVQGLIESSYQALLNNLFADTQGLVDGGQFDDAILTLQQALDTGLDNTAIYNKIAEYESLKRDQGVLEELANIVQNANRFADDNLYPEAFQTLQSFIDNHYYSASENVMTKAYEAYTQMENRYVDVILSNAETLRTENRYLEAINLLNNCLTPDHARINDMRLILLDEKPTYLCEMEGVLVNYEYYELVQYRIPEDTIGNSYESGNVYQLMDDGYCDYYLGYNYTKLTGIVAVCDTSDNTKVTLTISGDGKVLYEVRLSRAMTPVEIDIDVSSVNFLEIELSRSSSSTLNALLVDFAFEPTESN